MTYKNETGVPSVTQVLDPYIDKRWFTDEHRDRGTAVHQSLYAHAMGMWTPKLQPDWQGYVDSGKRWIDENVDRVLLAEKRLIDKDRKYCGQMDLVCIIHGDIQASLWDWKTAQAKAGWWQLQGAAYRELYRAQGLALPHRGGSIRPKKDGSKCLVDPYENHDYHFSIFMGLLAGWWFFNK